MDAEFEQEFNNPAPMHGVQENVAPTPAAVTWTDITDFQVYAPEGGTTLYANGKQQLKVRVSIRVKYKGLATVELDEQTLSTLTLVESGTGTPLVHDRFNPGDPIGWRYVLERNETFKSLPYQGPIVAGVEGAKVYSRDFYVSTTASTSILLSASVTRSDGTMFYSEAIKTHGRMTLNSVPPAVYLHNQFQLALIGKTPYESKNISKVEVYRLRLIVDQHQVDILKIDSLYPGVFLRKSSHPDYLGFYTSAYINGEEYPFAELLPFEMPHARAKYHNYPGAVTFLMSYAKKGGHSQIRTEQDAWSMVLLDMYGNTHAVIVKASEHSLPELRLS